jgi:hypothetical protein
MKPTNAGAGFVLFDPITEDFIERPPIDGRLISNNILRESE